MMATASAMSASTCAVSLGLPNATAEVPGIGSVLCRPATG
jgi:hypothetical protein